MSKLLKIKDPVFGYIEIADDDLNAVINSAMFQRLRDIVQTSYSSVYPSAVHNRFTHSLGVYYLGKIAQSCLSRDIKRQHLAAAENVDKYGKTFLLACLMHDIGHSPFSHTGEHFYFKERNAAAQPMIWRRLLDELADDDFVSDLPDGKVVGAEHEVMSAYVSIVNYPHIFEKYDKSFFTRCIIGLKYSDANDVRNCFIDLLNSKTIDVDKLDYLIRDSFTTGFKSINIDYKRLLNAVCVIKTGCSILQGFEKSALSTLESVILAHDMERKWIQNHPVIKYESNLVAYMIAKTQGAYEELQIPLFSAEALSEKGVQNENGRICLLSDADISSYAKKFYGKDKWITEFFSRGSRKKPLWKSESEYRFYFDKAGVAPNVLSLLEEKFKSLQDALILRYDFPVINQRVLDNFNYEIENAKFVPAVVSAGKKAELDKVICMINMLKDYSAEKEFPFEYVIIRANQFKTGFNKSELKNIRVRISDRENCILDDLLHLFNADNPRDNYFYLFVDSSAKGKVDVGELAQKIANFALHEYQQR